jgi:uncharacterized membrane protein
MMIMAAAFFAVLVAVFLVSRHDAFLYKTALARVTNVKSIRQTPVQDWHGNRDRRIRQQIHAVLLNGKHKGDAVRIVSTYTASQAFSQKYETGMQVFVHLGHRASGTWSGSITGVKRDTVVLIAAAVFVMLLLVVGKRQGACSAVSLLFNIGCLSLALDFYLSHRDLSLLAIFSVAVIICTVVSLVLIGGRRRSTIVAILATLVTTYVSLLIAVLAIHLTSGNGIHYDLMEFVTIPPEKIFLSELLTGSLGAIMDVAITITSSLDELQRRHPDVSKRRLRRAGFDIGGDIMGVMTNILLFAYISGSAPIIILCLKNGYPLNYAFSLNLSLEFIRFLVGSIGIVLAVPITIYLASQLLRRREAAS